MLDLCKVFWLMHPGTVLLVRLGLVAHWARRGHVMEAGVAVSQLQGKRYHALSSTDSC